MRKILDNPDETNVSHKSLKRRTFLSYGERRSWQWKKSQKDAMLLRKGATAEEMHVTFRSWKKWGMDFPMKPARPPAACLGPWPCSVPQSLLPSPWPALWPSSPFGPQHCASLNCCSVCWGNSSAGCLSPQKARNRGKQNHSWLPVSSLLQEFKVWIPGL